MTDKLVEYQLIIRNADDSADALEVTSVRGGTNPYISEDGIPSGDGASFDPITGVVTSGSFSVKIIDPITSGTSRLFTSILEDANGRQQLGHRRAFIKFREDGGSWQTLYAGRITRYALSNDIEWEIAVGDFMEAEHKHFAFAQKRDTTQTDGYEPFATYLARWPNRGSLLCGIRGGFLHIPDRKGWQFKIAEHGGVLEGTLDYRWTRCEFVSGYDPIGKAVAKNSDRLLQLRNEINAAAEPFWEPNYAESPFGSFPELRAIVDGTAYRFAQLAIDPVLGVSPRTLLSTGGGSAPTINSCVFYLQGHVGTLNSVVRVDIVSRAPTEASPIYWTGHPADLMSALWDEAGLPKSASAVSTIKDAIGRGARISLRITAPQNVGTFLEQAVYGLWGIGVRSGTAGELEPFNGRILVTNTLPAITITSADVEQGSTRAFDLETSKAIRTVNAEQARLVQPLLKRLGFKYVDPAATEALVVQRERVERENNDPGAIGTGEVTYQVPGMVHIAQAAPARERLEFRDWVDGRAHEIFDRTGRGAIGLTTTILRTSPAMSAKLGDEVLVDLPQLPNANKRLVDDPAVNARAMQILHLTPTLAGNRVTLEDSGPNAQPFATVPTITIAKSTGAPRSIATVTITNAAALNAAGAACRLHIALTSGSTPVAADYTDVLYFRPGQIPTAAQLLPPVAAASTIYARARAEHKTSRPSEWSAAVSVALDPLNAPTGLTATPSGTDGSKADLVWAVGANAGGALAEVWLRLQAEAFALAVLKELLPAGSTFYRLEGLTPGVNYTASVRHLDESTGDYSALAEVSFTAGATTVTLNAPTNPDGFSIPPGATDHALGRRISSSPARYGLVVVAQEFPSEVAVEEAMETAVGSGVYGAYAEVGRVASIAGDWTMWWRVARNDRLKRKLKARHVRDGSTASAYTAEVIVDPTTYDAVAVYPVAPPTASVTSILASRTATSETLQFNGALGANADGPLSWRYQEDDGAWSSPSTAALPQSVAFTRGKTTTKVVKLEVTQGDGQPAVAEGVVPAELPALRPFDGVITRTHPWDDGDYAVSSSASNGLAVKGTVNDSRGLAINTLFGKTADDLDDANDGVTYGRPRQTGLTGGDIDMSKSGVINRYGANVARSSVNPATLAAIVDRLTDGGNAASTMQDSRTSLINTHFGKSIDDQDDVTDGTTFKKTAGVNASNLITPSSTVGRNRAKVTHGSNQSITSATDTILAFNSESYDEGALHDTATNNSRLTVPTGGNVGVWAITAQVSFDLNATGFRRVKILKNGTTILGLVTALPVSGSESMLQCTAFDDAPAVGDYYEVQVLQNSGGALNVIAANTFFAITHLW